MPRALTVAAVVAAATAAPAQAAPMSAPALRPIVTMEGGTHAWDQHVRWAASFSRRRAGRISFAVMDERGRIHGSGTERRYSSASVVKAMLMVSYLRRADVRARALRPRDRALLAPMITRSDNDAASQVRNIVGNAALAALARRAGMKSFATAPIWGNSQITPADQVRFFIQIDKLVPARHRAYAAGLLSGIVGWQRWGIPRARPPGWSVFFKGGWRPNAGRRLVNQVALLTSGERRVAVAVLSDANPSHDYGTATIRGVATRLLSGLERSSAPTPRFRPLRSLG